MTLQKRLNLAMEHRRISQAELARKAGIAQPTVWRLTAGTALSTKKIIEISNALRVNPQWLATGEGKSNLNEIHSDEESNKIKIEVMNITASAGAGYINSDIKEVIKLIEYNALGSKSLFTGTDPSNLKIINISGDSMSETFESGDLIFVDITHRAFNGDGIYVFTFGSGLYVKRLQMIKNIIRVKSDNPLYEPWDIEAHEFDQFYIHGKVALAQSMKLKRYG